MPMFSLVVSTPSSGTDVTKVLADNPEAARRQFEADSNNAGCDILHVIAPEPMPVEIVIDLSGGYIRQVASNHADTSVVVLDNEQDDINIELESPNGLFAPDFSLNHDPNGQLMSPLVYCTVPVEHKPEMTGKYVRYTQDEAARKDFNTKVHEKFGALRNRFKGEPLMMGLSVLADS